MRKSNGETTRRSTRLLAAAAVTLLAACTSVSSLTSVQPGTMVSLRDKSVATPGRQPLKSTSFTNFEFKATYAGSQPFYGVLPLEFRGGHVAADILFFPPGMFLNLRTAFPYYEFDVDKQVVRFKENAADPWIEYRPTDAEMARAKAYFEATAGSAAVGAGTSP